MTTIDAKLLDGAFIVHLLPPNTSRNFQEYADTVFIPYVLKQLDSAKRIDVVWDVYIPESLKATTRHKRGHGQRRRLTPTSPIPSNWASGLRNDRNKEDLFQFLAKQLAILKMERTTIVSTLQDRAISNSPTTDVSVMDQSRTS